MTTKPDSKSQKPEMSTKHPNIALLERMTPGEVDPEIFADDVVFHYFNPGLPDMQGDYVGIEGVRDFFAKIGSLSKGTFRVNPLSISTMGDELVVTHTRNTLTIEGNRSIETEVVVVWRIANEHIVEVWDIPSIHAGVVEKRI